MLEYVRFCPKCERMYPESEIYCSDCDKLLPPPEPPRPPKEGFPLDDTNRETGQNISCHPQEQPHPSVPITIRIVNLSLYLPGTSMEYKVHSGDIIGQKHPSSFAQIQLSGIDGVNLIHRRHCQFELFDNEWFVIPLSQPDFINPTFLNIERLQPGQRYKITNGDKLTLGQTTFLIRITNE